MHIGWIDYTVIGVYLAVMAAVGIVCKALSRDVSDYLRAGNRATWWLAGSSMFMSGFSALTFTGMAGQAYAAGWSLLLIFAINTSALFLQAPFLAGWFRQTRAITSADNIRRRFGAVTEQLFAYIQVPSAILWGGTMLLGTSVFVSVMFNIPLLVVILMVGVVSLFYSVAGGSWSSMVNDYLQSLILLAVAVAVAVLCLVEVGGFSGMLHLIDARGLASDFRIVKPAGYQYGVDAHVTGGFFTAPWVVVSIWAAFTAASSLGGAGRYLAVKDGRDARRAALLAGGLMMLGAFIFFIPPMVARILFSEQVQSVKGISNPADAAYAIVCLKLLPAGLNGLVVVAIFSATMSSLDGMMTGSAGYIVQNIYPPLCRKFGIAERTGEDRLRLVRWVNLIVGLVIIGTTVGLQYGLGKYSLYALMQEMTQMFAPAMLGPLVLGLFLRRTPPWAPLVAIGVGLAVSGACNLAQLRGAGLLWHQKVVLIHTASFGVFLASTFFSRFSTRAFREQVDAFFRTMHTPVDFAAEVGKDTDLSQLRLIGWFGLLTGALILPLVAVARSPRDVVVILAMAGFVVFFGLLLLVVGVVSVRRMRRRLAAPTTRAAELQSATSAPAAARAV